MLSHYYYHTFYGPGELETYHHEKLQQSVKDAKLKVWYPGRWHRHSPRVYFRTRFEFDYSKYTDDDDDNEWGEEEEVVLLQFHSNAKIISAYLDCNICTDSDDGDRNNIHVDESLQGGEELHTTNLRWQSSMQTIHNTERLYAHDVILPTKESIGSMKTRENYIFMLYLELDATPDDGKSSSTAEETDSQNQQQQQQQQNIIHPPPCITLPSPHSNDSNLKRVDNNNQEVVEQQDNTAYWNWEWKTRSNDDEWIPISSCWISSSPCSSKDNVNYNITDDRPPQNQQHHVQCNNLHPIIISFPRAEQQQKQKQVLDSDNNKGLDTSSWRFPHQIDLCKVSSIISPKTAQFPTNSIADDLPQNCNDDDDVIVYDFGKELFGKVHVSIPASPPPPPPPSSSFSSTSGTNDKNNNNFQPNTVKIRVGETLAEAMNNDEEHFEQCLDLSYSLEEPDHGPSKTNADTNADHDKREEFKSGIMPNRHHTWVSCHLLAFRYVRIIVLVPNKEEDHYHRSRVTVTCRSHVPIIKQRGSFSCAAASISNVTKTTATTATTATQDEKIWRCATFTLQLCIHNNFILDGIKRDRLPWVGDLAVSIVSNAYAFHDEECVRWTLIILGRCGMDRLDYRSSNKKKNRNNGTIEGMLVVGDDDDDDVKQVEEAEIGDSHINGVVDYSLWFIISHWLYQRYFGDVHFLRQEWTLVERRLISLVQCHSNEETGRLVTNEHDWVFIDWTMDGEKETALQILWWYALDCGISLAGKMLVCPSKKIDGRLKKSTINNYAITLMKDTQSRLERSFLEMEDVQLGFSRHSHILGLLSGLYTRLDDIASEGEWSNPDSSDERWHILRRCRTLHNRSLKALLGDDLTPVATPYMYHLECLAISRHGERNSALDRVRSYWGAMLDVNATTFFEAFEKKETLSDTAKFYDRPFARSLCHAWAAGPCALYPEICLGLRPLSDGWEQWTCDPLDTIPSAFAIIETKYGTIDVQLDRDNLHVIIPKGTSMMLMGKVFSSSSSSEILSFPRKSLVSSQSVHEWSQKYRGWHHHASHIIEPNPMIPDFEAIQMTDVPTVYQLPGDDLFYMSFIGFDGDGYQTFVAESSDLLHWGNIRLAMGYGDEGTFDHGGVVLGAYLYESYDVDAPRILKRMDDGKFYSLYGAYAKKGTYEPDPGYQGLASSEDGLVWRREKGQSILSIYGPGIVKDWEKDSIYQPWLVEHDGTYYNVYNAKTMPQWIEQLGLATSKDLHNWTRHSDNPILRVGKRTDDASIDGFDTQFTSDAKVFYDGDKWVMFYFGVGKGGASIMIAFSKDLIQWVRDPIPLYTAGENPSGLDKQYAHKISLVWRDEKWYMFYCAVGNSGRGIGLITSQALLCDK